MIAPKQVNFSELPSSYLFRLRESAEGTKQIPCFHEGNLVLMMIVTTAIAKRILYGTI